VGEDVLVEHRVLKVREARHLAPPAVRQQLAPLAARPDLAVRRVLALRQRLGQPLPCAPASFPQPTSEVGGGSRAPRLSSALQATATGILDRRSYVAAGGEGSCRSRARTVANHGDGRARHAVPARVNEGDKVLLGTPQLLCTNKPQELRICRQ